MRVAVTGASGFVGGRTVRWLRAKGHDVVPYGRRTAAALRQPIPGYVAWDLTRGPVEMPVVDIVVHCAAHVGDAGDDPAFDAANVGGMRAVLASFPAPARVVHISSASVYDLEASTLGVSEDAPMGTRHLNAYGRTKVEAERILAASGRESIVLRPHIIYGPGDTHLLPGLIAARRLGWLPMYGNGTNLLSVTHVDNLMLAVERAIGRDAPSGVYNVADDGVAPLDEILRTLLTRTGLKARVAYVPRRIAWPAAVLIDSLPTAIRGRGDRKLSRFLVRHIAQDFTMDLTRARTRLGYVPRWTFRDGPLQEPTG